MSFATKKGMGGSILDIVYQRQKRESAHEFYGYNRPLDELKFILSIKTADDQTKYCITIFE